MTKLASHSFQMKISTELAIQWYFLLQFNDSKILLYLDIKYFILESGKAKDIKIKYDNFLKQTGLLNEHKPTEAYYKANFLRRVELNLQKGIDDKNQLHS